MSFNTNFNNIGGVTISSSYVASGFSSSKYLQLKDSWFYTNTKLRIYFQLNLYFTIAALSTNNILLGRDSKRSIYIYQPSSNTLRVQVSSDGDTYNVVLPDLTGVEADTAYRLRVVYMEDAGGRYRYHATLFKDDDAGTRVSGQELELAESTPPYGGNDAKLIFGTREGASSSYYFNGTIDLKRCSIQGDSTVGVVWTPYSDNPGSVTVGKGLYKYNDGTEISMTEPQTKGLDTLFDTKARKANLFIYRDSDGVSSFMASALTQPTTSPEGKTLSAVQSLNTPIYLNAAMDMIVSNPTAVFTITPTPSTATVTINGTVQSSVEVAEGSSVTWSVAADGYVTQEGTETVTADTTKTVTLEEESTVL